MHLRRQLMLRLLPGAQSYNMRRSSSSYRTMYFIQCACSPVTLMSNFRTNVLEAVQVVGRCLVSLFCFFASRLSSIPFTRSLHAHLLILVHLMTSWISQMLPTSSSRILSCGVLPVMYLKALIQGENLLILFIFL